MSSTNFITRNPNPLIDLSEQTFGRLTVVTRTPNNNRGDVMWLCFCKCGNQKVIRGACLRAGTTKSCGCISRELASARNWKGGRSKTGDGYIKIKKSNHLNADKKGYILEHTFVMSEHLGRPLEKNENIHHKNGIRADNRLENLELWSTSQPFGQRVEDKVAWAKEILRQAVLDKYRNK